jgi:hypothetical protein
MLHTCTASHMSTQIWTIRNLHRFYKTMQHVTYVHTIYHHPWWSLFLYHIVSEKNVNIHTGGTGIVYSSETYEFIPFFQWSSCCLLVIFLSSAINIYTIYFSRKPMKTSIHFPCAFFYIYWNSPFWYCNLLFQIGSCSIFDSLDSRSWFWH